VTCWHVLVRLGFRLGHFAREKRERPSLAGINISCTTTSSSSSWRRGRRPEEAAQLRDVPREKSPMRQDVAVFQLPPRQHRLRRALDGEAAAMGSTLGESHDARRP
jgi:hypothetical protein